MRVNIIGRGTGWENAPCDELAWGVTLINLKRDVDLVIDMNVYKVKADTKIPCFVLDDGRRVISGRGMTTAIGMKGRGQGIDRIASHRLLRVQIHGTKQRGQ